MTLWRVTQDGKREKVSGGAPKAAEVVEEAIEKAVEPEPEKPKASKATKRKARKSILG